MSEKKIKLHFGKVGVILLFVCAALVAADLILKYFEEAQDWNFTVIPSLIWVEHGHHNYGAAFSFLANADWGQTFLTVFSIALLAVLITAFLFLPERFVFLKTAVVLIIAGAIGNLADRLMFGYVRDFVWVNMLFTSACCNFADFFIVFGVIFAAVDFLFLNEWALIPLTKKAKRAQARERGAEEDEHKSEGGRGEGE